MASLCMLIVMLNNYFFCSRIISILIDIHLRRSVYDEWIMRLQKCIDSDGESVQWINHSFIVAIFSLQKRDKISDTKQRVVFYSVKNGWLKKRVLNAKYIRHEKPIFSGSTYNTSHNPCSNLFRATFQRIRRNCRNYY